MFNSQKINNDPFPYKVNGGSMTRCDKPGFVGRFDPRPEYDNNPNPILVKLRENSLGWETIEEIAKGNLGHIDHARKVLERLVNVYSD